MEQEKARKRASKANRQKQTPSCNKKQKELELYICDMAPFCNNVESCEHIEPHPLIIQDQAIECKTYCKAPEEIGFPESKQCVKVKRWNEKK